MSSSSILQLRVKISGRVQGVGYRAATYAHAKDLMSALELPLKGYVQNCEDDTVEAVFVGDEKIVKKMVEWCSKGSFLSKVKNVDVQEEAVNPSLGSFEIRK